MYFPTSAARQLSTVPALPNIPPEALIYLAPSPRKALFATLTRNGISVWRVRVRESIQASFDTKGLILALALCSPCVPFEDPFVNY